MADPITPEEYETWITPAQALVLVQFTLGAAMARSAIVRRIRSGAIRAVARTTHTGGRTLAYHPVPTEIIDHWTWGDAPDFWEGPGDIVLFESDDTGYTRRLVTDPTILEVRLEPTGLRSMLPPSAIPVPIVTDTPADWFGPAIPAPKPPPQSVPRPAAEPVRVSATKDNAPISEATLNAWWAMCLTIKKAPDWTDPEIRAFYDRCFPDKYGSRDRLRALRRGQVVPGPKGRAAE